MEEGKNINSKQQKGELFEREFKEITPEQRTRRESLLHIYNKVKNNPVPSTYKEGRTAITQISSIGQNLFSEIEENERGGYIIQGLEGKVDELDYYCYSMAVAQLLYNQSYQSGNEDKNTGLEGREVIYQRGKSVKGGYIATSLNNLCRLAFGTNSIDAKQKKGIENLIQTLHSTPVVTTLKKGDTIKSYITTITSEYTRQEDKAKFYILSVHPLFSEDVKGNFAEFPQDISFRLSKALNETKIKRTPEIIKLLLLLGKQDKRASHTLTISTLIDYLRIETAYKKNRTRVENSLISYFETMIKIGLLSSYEIERITGKGGKEKISRVTFHFSPKFNRKSIRTSKEEEKEEA